MCGIKFLQRSRKNVPDAAPFRTYKTQVVPMKSRAGLKGSARDHA